MYYSLVMAIRSDNCTVLRMPVIPPAGLEILEILRDDEHCVCHIEAALGYRQAYISQQLSVLREAGLIQDRRDGWNIYYRVIQPKVFDVLDTAQAVTGDTRVAVRRKPAKS